MKKSKSLHSLIHLQYLLYSGQGCGGSGAGHHVHTLTHSLTRRGNKKSPIDLQASFFKGWGKLENPEKTHVEMC